MPRRPTTEHSCNDCADRMNRFHGSDCKATPPTVVNRRLHQLHGKAPRSAVVGEIAIFRQPTGRTRHSCHSRTPTIWCLIRTMRRVRSVAMLTAAVLGLVLSASASPCPSQNTATKSSSKPVPTKQTSPTGKGQSDPCETAPSGAES